MEEFQVQQNQQQQQQLHKKMRDFTFYQNASQMEDLNSDSGYNSCQLTPNSSSFSFNCSTSLIRQTSVLATINEDCESAPTNQLIDTPTTASARLIDNFHLTTPNVPNSSFMASRPKGFQTPTKVDPLGTYFGLVRTPLRTISPNVKAQDANVTPRKGKISAKRRHSNFRDRLYSDENDCDQSEKRRCLKLDNDLSENADCRRLSDISPIMNKYGRSKSSEINNLMRSSTPKTAGLTMTNQWGQGERTPTKQQPAAKMKFRKFQSFSPSKMCSYKRPPLILNPPVIPEVPKIEHKDILTEVDSVLESSKPIDDVEMSFDMSDFNLTPAKPNNTKLNGSNEVQPVLEPVRLSTKKATLSAKKKLKRPQSRASSNKRWERIHKQQKEHRRSYEGFEKLNILKHLENNQPAINKILDYLTDADLVNVVQVSKGWQTIIESNQKSNKRLKCYLKQNRILKENQHVIEFKSSESRQPFSVVNNLDMTNDRKKSIVEISPPVSPSRRKFRQNQKIASHLKKSDTLTTCPRCSSFSKVIKAKRSKHPAMVKKSFSLVEGRNSVPTLFGDDNFNDSSNTIGAKIRRNLFATSTRSKKRANSIDSANLLSLLDNFEQKSDYAECTGLQCGFKFCVKCLCEYHPHTICPDFNPSSPSKEEERAEYSSLNIACSRKSKKSLLRLCK